MATKRRVKSSVLLRKAIPYIDVDRDVGLCAALDHAATRHWPGVSISARVQRDIPGKYIRHNLFVTGWLRDNCEEYRQWMADTLGYHGGALPYGIPEYAEAMRDYRVRWAKHLIEVYKAKGD